MKITKIASIFFAVILLFSLALCSCSDTTGTGNNDEDASLVYCCLEYGAGFGNYGCFAITTLDEGVEFETKFDDLEKFTLGGAFSGMSIDSVYFDEEDHQVVFSISGKLSAGRYGTVEGEGIVKGKSVKAEIPVSRAFASTEDVVYDNMEKQQIQIDLMQACFNKDVSVGDFTLSGALQNMTVESVSTDYAVDENGEDVLSQTAILTLSGYTNGSDHGYIEISEKATTYNEALKLSLSTEFRGAVISNDHIDTFKLNDVIYVEAQNITFSENIKAEDIVLEGALKDYAIIDEIDFVDTGLIGIHFSFPYTFINENNNIGYIKFAPQTNVENTEFVCSALVAAPDIECNMTIEGKKAEIVLTLDHEEFDLLDMYPFSIYDASGKEILVTGLEIINLDEYLSITFDLPTDYSGIIYFEILDAYSVVLQDGTNKSITVKAHFYI